MSELAAYYEGMTVFATGLTGCLGLVTAYRLLTATKVKRVYALIRAEPGQEQQRLEAAWDTNLPRFAGMLRKDKRIIAVRGDITAGPTLGIDRATLDVLKRDVHIVLALAADINLTRPAIKLVATNIQAPLDLATLASTFAHLERFVFVSTLYSQSHLARFDEKLRMFGDPEIELSALQAGAPAFEISPWYFQYGYTKNLAERILAKRFPKLPLMILRPSVVGPALQEPFPLFTYQQSMPTSNYLRLCRKLPLNQPMHHHTTTKQYENFFDEVPVDYVINIMLAHCAAGTLGPVHANTSSQPCTGWDVFHHAEDLIPPQVWQKDLGLQNMRGLAKVYRLAAVEHPIGSNEKTSRLLDRMSRKDLDKFPVDLSKFDLPKWHWDKAALFRRECEGAVVEVPILAKL